MNNEENKLDPWTGKYIKHKTSKSKKSFIQKLSSGEIRLIITFWVFLIFSNCTITMLVREGMDVITSSIGLTYAVFITAIAWKLYTIVGTWKSAEKYTGIPLWKNLAKVISIILLISVFADISTIWNLYSLLSNI